ncbi:MAG: Cysteine-tRNA ligase [candidate division TM6 bacterium GW2011_GWE2_41_16]|nr:MAG: Cysteine-tRNA ligase [candidate division TM6 bacterium GW2011_GWE2_41_16]
MQNRAVAHCVIKNTMSGKKEKVVFEPGQQVNVYVCGITPYDYAHLGHGRCNVTFDVLIRFLKELGTSVHYCRNYTDIDDKLMMRAERELGSENRYVEIADRFIAAFSEDIAALGCLTPDYQPRVTQEIPDIINSVRVLIDRGYAYVVDGDVYFSVDSFDGYGQLSKRDVNDLEVGARVAVSDKKRNPLDFAVWKSEDEGTFWESPWGWGRPGWHIECSVMAYKHLGEVIDIHGGGMDLIFPHHENERAQSCAMLGVDPVRIWMHNAFVQINNEKMSKSLGNFFTLRDLYQKYDPMVLRYIFLMHHYRSPIDFSFDLCDMAKTTYERLVRMLGDIDAQRPVNFEGPYMQRMMEFMLDDLNTVGMLGVVFDALKDTDTTERAHIKWFLQNICGLALIKQPLVELELSAEIKELIDQRVAARAVKDWKKSDELRDKLAALGHKVQDKKL